MALLRRQVPKEKDVLWIFSSGTQSVNQVKCIGLTFEALFESARVVNSFLEVTRKDRWSIEIPTYHIGGFAILARAHLSGSKVYRSTKWEPAGFLKRLKDNKISLTSLVPTQVYDLVALGRPAPAGLRAVVVGGGGLDPNVYKKARALKWPLLPSYGLTECASQVATAALNTLEKTEFPALTVLPHAQVSFEQQRILIRCQSLCQWVTTTRTDGVFTLEDPLRRGWFQTEDVGEWAGPQVPGRPATLRVLGRRDDVVKIYGVLVSVPQVESDLRRLAEQKGFPWSEAVTVIARTEGREGTRLHLVSEKKDWLSRLEELRRIYNGSVNGPFRVHNIFSVPEIPRTALGKIKRAELLARLEASPPIP